MVPTKDYRTAFRPYQFEGVEFLDASHGRAGLGDDTGMGKSAQALIFMAQHPRIRKTLIITTATALYKWQREVQMWTGRAAEVFEGGVPRINGNRFIHIVSWSNLAAWVNDLRKFQYDLIIPDEGHKAKNWKADRTKALMKLQRGVPYLIFLSATPFLNHREEMWTMLHMLDPQRWGSLAQFRETYCNDNRGAENWNVHNVTDLKAMQAKVAEVNRAKLAADITPYFLRRRKSEHLPELGQPTWSPYPFPLPPGNPLTQQYQLAVKDFYTYLRSAGKYVAGQIPAKALVQIGVLRRLTGKIKTERAIAIAEDLLEEDEQRKIVVYAIHHDVVARLERALAGYGVRTIDGSTPKKLRDQYQQAFQAGTPRVMVISEAGEEAIDLYRAQDILFAERGWTPKSEDQALGRLHRIGQAGLVTAHVPLLLGTFDVRLDHLLERKRQEVEGVIGADAYRQLTVADFEHELADDLAAQPLL